MSNKQTNIPMKRVLLFAAVITMSVIGKAQSTDKPMTKADSANMPVMLFESETLDYGTIENGSDGNREFKVKNIGKEPLIISQVIPTCGCTFPQVPTEPILPGKTGIIKVHYDTKRVGAFEKGITVKSNSKTPGMMIHIKGVVNPPVLPKQ